MLIGSLLLLSTLVGQSSLPSSVPAPIHLNTFTSAVVKRLPSTNFYHNTAIRSELQRLKDLKHPKTLSVLVDSPLKIHALEQYSQNVSQPGNPWYHHFLTPRALRERFGPSPQALRRAVQAIRAAGWTPQAAHGFLITAQAPAHQSNPAIPVSSEIWSVNGLSPLRILHQYTTRPIRTLPHSHATIHIKTENVGSPSTTLSGFQFNNPPTDMQQFATSSEDQISLLSWNPDFTRAIPAGLPFNLFVAASNPQGTPVAISHITQMSATGKVVVYGSPKAMPASHNTLWHIELAGYTASSASSTISLTISLSNGQSQSIHGTIPPFTGSATALPALTGPELNSATQNPSLMAQTSSRSPVALYVQGQIPSLGELQQLMTQENLPMPQVNFHYASGATAAMVNTQDSAESNLDIQAVASIDPKARIDEYVFPSNDPNPLVSFLNDLSQQTTVKIASLSYGFFGSDPSSLSPLIAACNAEGITVIAASGDQGAWNTGADPGPVGIDLLNSQPGVLSVGGLDIASPAQFNNTGIMTAISPPVLAKAWGGSYLNALPSALAQAYTAPNAASSGGFGSSPIPSWQRSFLPSSASGIGAPDISALAGIPALLGMAGGKPVAMGGTSLAAPLTAGWLSLAENHSGQVQGLGNVNPWLFHMASSHSQDFTQAQWGSNGVYSVTSAQGGSWNPVTGLGLPNWSQLASSLGTQPSSSSPVATHLTINPNQAQVQAGQPLTVTIQALSASGALTNNLPGTVTVQGTDPQATLPSTLTLTKGQGQFTAVFRTPGIQHLTVAVKHSGQTLFQTTATVDVHGITLSLPAHPVINTPMTIQALGGTSGTQYQYWMQNPATTNWISSGPFRSRSTWSVTAPVPGVYPVFLYVQTAQGPKLAATTHITVANAGSMPRVDGLSIATPHIRLAANTSTQVSATAADPGGSPEYQFWLRGPSNRWKVVQNYSPNNTLSLHSLPSGSYVVAVYALDKAQVAHGLYSQAFGHSTVIDVNSRVSLVAPSTSARSQSVTVTATASGLTDPVYQLWYETPSGQWRASGNYQSQGSFTFTPSETGTYHLVVYAKDPDAPATAFYAVTAQSSLSVS